MTGLKNLDVFISSITMKDWRRISLHQLVQLGHQKITANP
jgi:hypothetical protein